MSHVRLMLMLAYLIELLHARKLHEEIHSALKIDLKKKTQNKNYAHFHIYTFNRLTKQFAI